MTNLNVLASLLTASTLRRVTAIRMSALGAFGIPMFEHITDLRGFNWQKTRAEVVADIRAGATYYTDEDLGPRAILEVVNPSILSVPYVRTRPDCTTANNLLTLPRF
jgi:hypothetical protein